MLVVDPKTQKLRIRVRDSVDYLGLANITVGYSTVHTSFKNNSWRIPFSIEPLISSIPVQIVFCILKKCDS